MSQQNSKFYTQVSGDTDIEDDIEYQKKHTKKTKSKGLLSLMLDPWFIFFTFCLLGSILFIPFWFYNNEIVFYICGGLTLLMLIFAIYKFYTLASRKHLLNTYKNLNRKYLKENIIQKAQIDRTCKAINILKDTQKRITKNNAINRNNTKLFEDIQTKIKTAQIEENTETKASTLLHEWQTEYIKNEKQTLNKIYNRFIQEKSGNHNNILETLNREQFDEFQYNILPIIYRATLAKLNVFDELDPHGDGVINVKALEKYLNKIAENIDIVNDNTFQDIENDEFKLNTITIGSVVSKPKHKSNNAAKSVKKKESLFADDYDIVEVIEPKTISQPVKRKKESLFADDYEIVSDSGSDKEKHKSNKPPDIQTDITPISKRKESLFADDYDILNEKDKKKQKRKIGKLKHGWGDTPTVDNKFDKHKSSKVINPDESWVRHKSVKVKHPVHESIDALQVNKLVSKSVKMFPSSPIYEEKEKGDDNRKNKEVQRKESLPDESWIKHKSPKRKHDKHGSVEQLQLKQLVSEASLKKGNALSTVGENEEQTPLRNNEQDDPFDIQ